MVANAYHKVKSNKGSGGIDNMSWADLDKDLDLYKLWNRLSSGCYFLLPVKEVEKAKKDAGIRKLGIPVILDRITEEVVRVHLERIGEPLFHDDSYGYRRGRSCRQAVGKTLSNIMNHDWVIDLDIQSFFDTIDHDLMMKAVEPYCQDKWVLLYVERWLKAGLLNKSGIVLERATGTPQGSVISPLLANVFLHVVFDKWMKLHHPEKLFVRYADDIVVHRKTNNQARYVLALIRNRMSACKLTLHAQKTRIINMRGIITEKHPRSFYFLGFTFKPYWTKTEKGFKILNTTFISQKSMSSIQDKFRRMELHKRRKPVEVLAKMLNPITRGIINYYCKLWAGHSYRLWQQLNFRLWKWVRWEKGLTAKSWYQWLKTKYKENPNLFYHWKIAHP
jgi:group II intron reverse transcriptase/maturase